MSATNVCIGTTNHGTACKLISLFGKNTCRFHSSKNETSKDKEQEVENDSDNEYLEKEEEEYLNQKYDSKTLVICYTGGKIETSTKKPTLNFYQKAVGGSIATHYLKPKHNGNEYVIICNDEGILKQLPLNLGIMVFGVNTLQTPIFGNVVLVPVQLFYN